MEWNQPGQAQPANQAAHQPTSSKGRKLALIRMRIASVGLLFCIAVLVLAVIAWVTFGVNTTSSGGKYVDKSKMQAVFLNGGQVYFGKINSTNDKYMRVSDIYYLRVNQTVQPNQTNSNGQATSNDISLVKLGCELHGPDDQMVINQAQVIFWENLKTDGQVAKAVAQYKQQNPNGQKCDTSTTGSTTPTTTTPTTTTPSTTKKP